MASINPVKYSILDTSATVSEKEFSIAGLHTVVWGIEELHPQKKNVACLWLMHPRLLTAQVMAPIAATIISAWNEHAKQKGSPGEAIGLIAAGTDQPHHGKREVNDVAKQDWRHGNETHAQDMFSGYRKLPLSISDCQALY